MSGDSEESEGAGGPSLPSVADMAMALRKRAKLILGCTLILGSCAFGLVSLLTPQYLAKASVLIDPREKTISEIKEITPSLEGNTPTIESEAEIVRSTEIAGRVIDELKLGDDPELLRGDSLLHNLKVAVLGALGKPEAANALPGDLIADSAQAGTAKEGPVDAFVQRITAERVRESLLIEIGYKSRDAEKAARVVNAIAEAYVHTQIESKTRTAQLVTAWLDRRIAMLRERVFKAEQAVSAFKSENHLVDSEGHLLDEHEVARQMEQLIITRSSTAQARAKYQRVKELLKTEAGVDTLGDVLEAHTITALKEQLGQVERTQAELATKYGAMHPSMIKANAQVQSAREQLQAEIDRIVANLRSEAEVAEQREADLEKSLSNLKTSANESSAMMVRLRELEREATAARDVYEAYLKRAQETAQQQNFQVPDSRVIDRATVPTTPVSPKRMLIIAGGFGGGLFLGLGLTVLLEMMFPSFVRRQQVEAKLKTKHLATIAGRIGRHSQVPSLRQLRRILLEPQSAFAEAIRGVRVGIERSRARPGPLVVLVTSAVAAEGKSVIASNLALNYALSGVRTLLIDCDLRGNGMTRSLRARAGGSLVSAIMRRQPMQAAIVREAKTGVHFLPAVGAEKVAITPAELLASPPMAMALRQLRGEFEIIVLDGHALLAGVESRILAGLADQIVLVHRWKHTGLSTAGKALEALDKNRDKVTGVIVNLVPPDQLGTERAQARKEPRRRREPRLAEPVLSRS